MNTDAFSHESGGAQEPAEDPETAPRERAGRRQLGLMLDLLTGYYRDLLAARLGGKEAPLLHVNRADQVFEDAERRQPQFWAHCVEQLLKARRRIDQNANPRLVIDSLAAELTGCRV